MPWALPAENVHTLRGDVGDGYRGGMPAFAYRTPAALRGLVASCVGYDFRTPPGLVHHGLPSTALTMIISFEEPLDCGWDERERDRFWMLVGGLHLRPAQIRTLGRQHGIQLSLTPLGARVLLGVPASELAHQLVHHSELGVALGGDLQDRMVIAPWPERFRLLDCHLLGVTGNSRFALDPSLTEAWRLLTNGAGGERVDDVARRVGWSRRQLSSRFASEFGVSPKQVARLARFEQASQMVKSGRPLAEVARHAGYSDQPHMNREFRELAGLTPTGVAEDFPIVQDPQV